MTTVIPRAERVALPMPIMYRRSTDDEWFRSTVVNVSESGVLFGPSELVPGTSIEVILSLPVQVRMMASGKQLCVAQIVRVTEAGAVAARFEECRFLLEE